MQEQIILLRHWILSRQATNTEHKQAQKRLENIVQGFRAQLSAKEKEIQQLKSQLNEKDNDTRKEK